MSKKPADKVKTTALAITKWVGSLPSIIIHTLVFAASFATVLLGVFPFDRMLLVLTTLVSLEAIYLSLFIQMTVNYTTETIEEVEHSLDEIEEDVGEIQEDIDEMQEDVEEIQEDVDEIQEDVDELQPRRPSLLGDGVPTRASGEVTSGEGKTLEEIYTGLKKLMEDVEKLQNKG